MARYASSFCLAPLLAILVGSATCFSHAADLVIENTRYRIEVGRDHGVVARILDKAGGLELIQERRLADNFRFSLPLPGKAAWQATEANYILGRNQRLTSHEKTDSGMVLRWDGPLTSLFGKPYDVSVTMTIELSGPDIRFGLRVDNKTHYEIGEVYYPILGGSLGLGDRTKLRKQTELVIPSGVGVETANIFHTFTNFSWLGVMGPEQYYSYPDKLSMPWIELYQPTLERGFYFGAHDPSVRFKVVHLEMFPGISGNRKSGNWPRADERQGLPTGVKICFVHIPYAAGPTVFRAAPVVLRCHGGGWKEAARVYGKWMASTFDLKPAQRSWMYRNGAFQDCRSIPFAALPAWAEQGMKYGVEGLLLSEWKTGGHGDGVPHFEPDPKLGTPDELRDAIRQCHALGVHVMLLVNLQLVSQHSAWYRKELHRYACQDRWGIVYSRFGWRGGSVPSRQYGSGERRVWLNPGAPGLRAILGKQLRDMAELGVDGVYLRDFFGRPLDFNRVNGKTPDRASWEGGLECIRDLLATCRVVNPDFCVAVDSAWDRLLPLSQTVGQDSPRQSAFHAAFPSWRPTITVSEGYEFSAANDVLLRGARLRIAPSTGKPIDTAGLGDLGGYIRVILQVRDVLSSSLVLGEFAEHETFHATGASAISVYRNAKTGARTAVVVNSKPQDAAVTVVGFENTRGKRLLIWQPLTGVKQVEMPINIAIPGDQVAIVTEEPERSRLSTVKPWRPTVESGHRRVVFAFRSASDLEGWTIKGEAFGVSTLPGLCRRPTLNSRARAGESATGTAWSPAFVVDPEYDTLELFWHGGTSQKIHGRENLAVRIIAARTGEILREITPPGTHVLTVHSAQIKDLRGREIRLELVDKNTANTFAWIGLAQVTLRQRKLVKTQTLEMHGNLDGIAGTCRRIMVPAHSRATPDVLERSILRSRSLRIAKLLGVWSF